MSWVQTVGGGVLVFLVGATSVYSLSRVYRQLTAEKVSSQRLEPVRDCEPKRAALAARKQELKRSFDQLSEELEARYVAQGSGPLPLPSSGMPRGSVEVMVRSVFGRQARLIHCREYPCVLVLDQAPDPAQAKQLADGGWVAKVVPHASLWVARLEVEGVAEPPRAEKRVAAILRTLER